MSGKNRDWMRKAWKPVAGVGVMVLFIAWGAGVFHGKPELPEGGGAAGVPVDPAAAVSVVVREDVTPPLDVTGTVTSGEMVHLSSRLSAYVRKVHVTAGQAVRKGDVLVELDDREIQEQVTGAEAQLRQAEAEFHRTEQLFAKQATTEQAMTLAESAYRAAQAQAESARVMRTYATLMAPIDGIVTDRRVEAGDLANPGQVLLSVYDPVNMRLEAPVPLRLAEKLALGQAVAVELDRPAGVVTGVVALIVSEVDPRSRSQLVKVQLPLATGGILPGTFGRLWVRDDPRAALLVPGTAVYRVGQLELVHRVMDGRVVRRAVKSGQAFGDRVEILAGLAAGDTVLREPSALAQ